MTTPELKPCPFCGSNASLFFVTGCDFHWTAKCDSEDCMATIRRHAKTGISKTDPAKNEVRKKWNTRINQ